MADVAATLAGWSSTTGSNAPSGGATIGTGLDDNLREIQGVIVRGLSHKGADIASATTTDIGAIEGLAHDITGTTTITGLGTVRAGIWKVLKFEGALTLTHNATSLILPGGANITTADGDIAVVISEGSGNWRCVSYVKANGSSIAPPGKNTIINGGFTVNQRAYASSAVLASGSYGHDRWKAGAGGGDYSFTQLAHNTTITIASGKTLIQVIEDKNVVGGTYVLSWIGTAQARAGVDSATPSGSYAASPLTITGQTAGTVMSVEFNTGTLSKVQLEAGSVATEFEYRTFQEELARCKRYFFRRQSSGNNDLGLPGYGYTTNVQQNFVDRFEVEMRSAPTFSISAAADFYIVANATTTAATGLAAAKLDKWGALLTTNNTSFAVNIPASLHADDATGWMQYSAEI